MGLFLAATTPEGSWLIGLLCIFTAALLQILSNFANDYGDARHGLDNEQRLGPKRAVQSGLIGSKAMRNAMLIMAMLAVVSGIGLVALAFGPQNLLLSLLFVALGGAAIWAAIAYTATKNPYGYVGLGDVMVFVFFGLVAVLGSYFLQVKSLSWDLLLPASASGLLSVAVLNVNNVRDLESDKKAGKKSIPVRLGARKARLYHAGLLLGAALAAFSYVLSHYSSPWQYLFIFSLPLMLLNGIRLWQRQEAREIDPLLKQMSITTLIFTLLFGIGQMI
jgi:1,4-dihydroxy-2-naphthoate octaprenyltransferase